MARTGTDPQGDDTTPHPDKAATTDDAWPDTAAPTGTGR